VTFKSPKGDVRTLPVGPQVKNFDQIKVGDMVVVRYFEALTRPRPSPARRRPPGRRARSPWSPTWSPSTPRAARSRCAARSRR
jgi:hypothetical protein